MSSCTVRRAAACATEAEKTLAAIAPGQRVKTPSRQPNISRASPIYNRRAIFAPIPQIFTLNRTQVLPQIPLRKNRLSSPGPTPQACSNASKTWNFPRLCANTEREPKFDERRRPLKTRRQRERTRVPLSLPTSSRPRLPLCSQYVRPSGNRRGNCARNFLIAHKEWPCLFAREGKSARLSNRRCPQHAAHALA
jgi:hypothetical protein